MTQKINKKDLEKQVDSPMVHFINHESRISRLESTMDSINSTLIRLENKMDNGFNRVENKIDTNIRWTMGIIVSVIIGFTSLILKHK